MPPPSPLPRLSIDVARTQDTWRFTLCPEMRALFRKGWGEVALTIQGGQPLGGIHLRAIATLLTHNGAYQGVDLVRGSDGEVVLSQEINRTLTGPG